MQDTRCVSYCSMVKAPSATFFLAPFSVNMRTDASTKRYHQTLPLMGATRPASVFSAASLSSEKRVVRPCAAYRGGHKDISYISDIRLAPCFLHKLRQSWSPCLQDTNLTDTITPHKLRYPPLIKHFLPLKHSTPLFAIKYLFSVK